MTLTGEMLIGFAAVRGSEGSLAAFNPATHAEIPEPTFGLGGPAEVDRAARPVSYTHLTLPTSDLV